MRGPTVSYRLHRLHRLGVRIRREGGAFHCATGPNQPPNPRHAVGIRPPFAAVSTPWGLNRAAVSNFNPPSPARVSAPPATVMLASARSRMVLTTALPVAPRTGHSQGRS